MDVNAAALAAELARCRCSYHSTGGGSYGDYLIFSWLWREIHWWPILVYTAVLVALGMMRAALGSGSDC